MTSSRSMPTWKTRFGRTISQADAERSPQITFRLDDDMLQRASHVAHRDGLSLSALARQALDDYLSSHP